MSLDVFFDNFNAHMLADSGLKNFAQTHWRKPLAHVDGDVNLEKLHPSKLPALVSDIGPGVLGGEVLGGGQYTNTGNLECALVWLEDNPEQAAQQRRKVVNEFVQAVMRGNTFGDTVTDVAVLDYEPLVAAHNPNMRLMRFTVEFELDEVAT